MEDRVCSCQTDAAGREIVLHGRPQFPLACYEDDQTRCFVPWHWHEEFECIAAVAGAVALGVRGEKLVIPAGHGLFINAGVLHNVEQETPGPAVLRSVVFHPRLIGGSADSVFWQTLVQPLLQDKAFPFCVLDPAVPWQKAVVEDVLSVWDAVTGEGEDFENYARYRLSAAFRQLNRFRPGERRELSRQDQISAQRIKQMLRFLQDHYAEEVTVERLAASVSVSPSVCLRCFRQMLGVTPIQYLKRLRLDQAAHMLLATELPVHRIGLECGFSDLSYFTKTFRQEKGMTPREYRKRRQSRNL